MYILIFVLWIILTQKFNLEIIIFGVAITSVMYLLMKSLFDYDLKKDLSYVKKFPLFIKYLILLTFEIIKASISMIKIIFNKEIKINPTVVSFKSGLKTKMGNFILANSITLTPGTVTIKNEGDKFIVHCLSRDMLDISSNSVFISNIKKLEGK